MGAVPSHEQPSEPAAGRRTSVGEKDTVPEAVPCVSKKRGPRIEDLVHEESLSPVKRRRIESPDCRDECEHLAVRRPEDDLRVSHAQSHQLRSDIDALARVRNAPPDIATSGPLPPILLARHGILDGLAAIHNAPSMLLAPLPPIQTLDGEGEERPIHEPAPLRPWQLVGGQPSLLVDLEHRGEEYLESRVSILNDDGTIPENYNDAQSESPSWEAITVRDEGSPNYSPSPIPSVPPALPPTHYAANPNMWFPGYNPPPALEGSPDRNLSLSLSAAARAAGLDVQSPEYNPSPVPSVLIQPPNTYVTEPEDEAEPEPRPQSADSTFQFTGLPRVESPPRYIRGVTSPDWSAENTPSPPTTPQEHKRDLQEPDDAETEWRDGSSVTLFG
ncbi:MAG: hypothetical protein M1839_005255 [Geoglossum umbratile]|nr:MAG: hypothetical protein M1839_005255 [Geoglossum umbratile]